ncbi:hypothetical protein FRB99_008016 [Tulasnella sp. 403]|nr:hypothetical protein FRB99_008016 [Tulasnella sp. 403]
MEQDAPLPPFDVVNAILNKAPAWLHQLLAFQAQQNNQLLQNLVTHRQNQVQQVTVAAGAEAATQAAMQIQIQARNWLTGIQATNPILLNNYGMFVAAFHAHFSDPDITGTCLHKLEHLMQKTSTVDYAARFNELHA